MLISVTWLVGSVADTNAVVTCETNYFEIILKLFHCLISNVGPNHV